VSNFRIRNFAVVAVLSTTFIVVVVYVAAGAVPGQRNTPSVETLPAFGVHGTEAVLAGAINAHGGETQFKFEYGRTIKYGMSPGVGEEIITGRERTHVAEAIVGLRPRTVYHFRLVAFNRDGAIAGRDRMYKTTRRP
jgi:hypothetical protein